MEDAVIGSSTKRPRIEQSSSSDSTSTSESDDSESTSSLSDSEDEPLLPHSPPPTKTKVATTP